jgi:fatty acid desaturase
LVIRDFPSRPTGVEWPTIALAALIYGLWLGATFFHDRLPLIVLVAIGGWTTAWQMNLQHEVIHGHPTRNRWVNKAIGFWPLALWLPFALYRRTHLQHHNDERLTDPLDDPESYYWTSEHWDAAGAFGRGIVRLQATLLGRIVIGPLWAMSRLWIGEGRRIARGDSEALRALLIHLLQIAPVLIWIKLVCGMSLVTYLICFVYAGTALAMVRSFAEHRAESEAERRTAIVERSWIFGTLFLFNNLHVAHHMRPSLAWYLLPRWYRQNRAALIERNGGLVYDSYLDIFRRYLLRRHDQSLHPFRPSVAMPPQWAVDRLNKAEQPAQTSL